MPGIGIEDDEGSIRRLAEVLRAVPKELQPQVRAAVKAAGESAATIARSDAAAFSTRIPGAIRVRTSFARRTLAGVRIEAAAGSAPHARPYAGLYQSVWRHPLFGNRDRWFPQQARFYFDRAITEGGEQAAQGSERAVLDVMRRAGFELVR